MITNDKRNWQVSITDPFTRVEGVEDIAQCVYAIIATVKGSDPLRPDFGSDVYLHLDKPMNEAQPMLIYAAMEAVKKWEKRIEVKKCRLEANGLDKRNLVIEAVEANTSEWITIKTSI
ncbi:MAG: GPW/gp25 family protein [Dysgonamonadaceae bacterium]|jgi:phage baseplate assembly protein W|nr:GPW/gp25 family protein [Dysgonamonadaceae bacterium]